ncbi:nestin isoform X2 [Harmonia axyridis]|uniref:nestin isoform X2 n=1 Tax=Harmonia axyridis TaxID=115357 RepID=UPI001E2791F1|nr:nestin isoform X2 [Harmonia axyridis]
MEVCRRSSWLLTLLGVILLAGTLQGVQGEVEIEGPSESECRPYIEKALRELEHVGGGDADVGQSNEEASSLDNLSIDEKQSDEQRSQETSEESTDTEATTEDQEDQAEITEAKTDDSTESEAENDVEEVVDTASVETSTEEAQKDTTETQSRESEETEDKSSTELPPDGEEVEIPPTNESKETEEDSASVEQAQLEAPPSEISEETSVENQEAPIVEQSTPVESSKEASVEETEEVKEQLKEDVSKEVSAEEAQTVDEAQKSNEIDERTESNETEEDRDTPSDEIRTDSDTINEVSTESNEETEKSIETPEDGKEVKNEDEDKDSSSSEKDEDKPLTPTEVEDGKSNESLEQQDEDQKSEDAVESIREKRDVDESDEQPSKEQAEEANETTEDTQNNSTEPNEDSEAKSEEQDAQKVEQESAESVENKEGNASNSTETEEVTKSDEDNEKSETNDSERDEKVESAESNIKSESTEKDAEGSVEAKEDGSSKEGDSTEDAPEEELINGMEIPEDLRSRGHVEQLLKLDKEATKSEEIIDRVSEITLRELKRLYENAIKPLETLYKYRDLSNRHYGDAEIFSKPLILFMGPWSGGKSSIINYLLNVEYNDTALRTGAEPSPAYFNLLMYGEDEEVLDGTQLAADYTFSGLQKFGQGLEERLRGLKLKSKLLEKVNIVEIPGILEVRKQISRVFPFNDACQWFIDRADIIFLVYDPFKLDIGPETEAILDQLKGREYQTRIILNKADQVKPEELMRVQGALIWNISPLMSSPQPPVMYTTSLWSRPYENWAPVRLLQAQERAFLRDLRSAVDRRIENKIASARRFAVRVRNHAKMVDCYLTTYYNHKSIFGNKKHVSDAIIEHPQDYHIYEGLSTLTNISRYDLPDPEVYRDFFKLNPLYEFQQLSATCTYFRGCPINKLDVAIAYDLPELVGKHKRLIEAALTENSKQEQAQGS